MLDSRKLYRAALLFLAAVYLALAIGSSLTKRPWSDEGWFASPAYNLITKGSMGTSVLEPVGWLKGIDKYTFWVAPLHLVTQAGWYEIFGFGLIQMRGLSAAFGLLALFSILVITRELSGDRKVALLAFALLAFDYVFINGASFGRMDMMCAALGLAGLAAYLCLRERNFNRAIFVSHALVVLSGLTHFNGLLYLAGLLFLTFYFDRRRLRWQHAAIAAIPYLAGAAGWGIYILQSPETFLTQFRGNAVTDSRLKVLTAPLSGLKAEITQRYLVAYGLGGHLEGNIGPIVLKILIPIAYLTSIIGVLCTRSLRQHKGHRALLILIAIYFVIMTLLDGQKLAWYLIHIVPLYTALLAVWANHLWTKPQVPRVLVAACLSGFVLLQLGGVLYRIKIDSYRKSYLPAIAFLKAHAQPASLIVGSADVAFGLGFDRNVTDDFRLGYDSGRKPDFIVVEEIYRDNYNALVRSQPQVLEYVNRLLSEEYEVIYDQMFYKIYAPRKRGAAASERTKTAAG